MAHTDHEERVECHRLSTIQLVDKRLVLTNTQHINKRRANNLFRLRPAECEECHWSCDEPAATAGGGGACDVSA